MALSLKLNRYGAHSQTFLETRRGFYNVAFSTTIHQASAKDIELRELYAIQLISSYHQLMVPFIHLVEKDDKGTLNSHETVYYVYVGKMVWGKLSISVSKMPKESTIWIIYKYRTEAGDYHRVNGGNHRDSKTNSNMRHWKRNASKRARQMKDKKED